MLSGLSDYLVQEYIAFVALCEKNINKREIGTPVQLPKSLLWLSSSTAKSIAARIIKRVKNGYIAKISSNVNPSESFCISSSTVMRVPLISGLPCIMSGLRSINGCSRARSFDSKKPISSAPSPKYPSTSPSD